MDGYPDWRAAGLIIVGFAVIYFKSQARWTDEEFMNTLRTGVTPEGREIRGEYMPWGSYKFMDDTELKAVWVYLQSLLKLEYGSR